MSRSQANCTPRIIRRFKRSPYIDLSQQPLGAVLIWVRQTVPLGGYTDRAMEIESTTFGTITIDGKTYEHDVIIRLSGEMRQNTRRPHPRSRPRQNETA